MRSRLRWRQFKRRRLQPFFEYDPVGFRVPKNRSPRLKLGLHPSGVALHREELVGGEEVGEDEEGLHVRQATAGTDPLAEAVRHESLLVVDQFSVVQEMFRVELLGGLPEDRAAVAGAEVGHDEGVGWEVVPPQRRIADSLVHKTSRSNVGETLDLLEDSHGVGKLAMHLPVDVDALATNLVDLRLHFLLDLQVARKNPQCPP